MIAKKHFKPMYAPMDGEQNGIPFNGGTLYFQDGQYIFKPGETDFNEAKKCVPKSIEKRMRALLEQDSYSQYY